MISHGLHDLVCLGTPSSIFLIKDVVKTCVAPGVLAFVTLVVTSSIRKSVVFAFLALLQPTGH
jgi:hypothetical protein